MRTALDVAVAKPSPIPAEVVVLDGKVREGLDRADRLVEGFLVLGRAEHGELPDRAEVRLDRLTLLALAEDEAERAARGIAAERRIEAVIVSGSPTLLARMVENLVDNGIRHNAAGGRLLVALADTGDGARLTVESDGPTLDRARVDELVQPFRRLGVERTGSVRGAGLGLSIVAAIVAAHGGTLALEARPEGGLRVAVDLPRHGPADPTGAAPKRAAP